MPIATKYLFIVSMDVAPDKEALFNEVYDTEHVPYISKVPGVRGATRMKGEAFTMQLGGKKIEKPHDGPSYTAIYEIDNRRPLEPRVGRSRRERPLAGRSPSVHTQSTPLGLQGALTESASVARATEWMRPNR
jgi:hypothetical protein